STVFAIAFTVDGLMQSTGWPGTVKAMTPWWPSSERGRIMGRWATCYQAGGLAATALATWLLTHFGWRAAYFAPAAWTAAVGVAVAGGWLSDKWRERRGAISLGMTLGLAISFILYIQLAALGPWANFSGMALVGFMLFGPDALVSSVAAQDLGGEHGAGTAAG